MINQEDLQIEAGAHAHPKGMCVSMPSVAVRVVHKPTGYVESCDFYRSQSKNLDACIKALELRLNNQPKTPRTDLRESQIEYSHMMSLGPDVRLKEAVEHARKLEIELNILYSFINEEMKMTAGDPRIAKLKERIEDETK